MLLWSLRGAICEIVETQSEVVWSLVRGMERRIVIDIS